MKQEIVNGSIESGDVLVNITPIEKEGYELEIETTVPRFKKIFEKNANEILKKNNASGMKVHIKDSGALDYVLEARLQVSLNRFNAS